MASDHPTVGVSRRSFIQTVGLSGAATALSAQADAQIQDQPGSSDSQGPRVLGPGPVKARLRINGRDHEHEIEPATTLMDFLRTRSGHSGVKEVCDRGACGACSVEVDGVLVASCMMLALDAEGSEITTIEDLGDGETLDPIQESFIRHDALQCGYCTPGLIMAVRTLLAENAKPTLDQIKKGLSGNLCRCGTYTNVFNAVLDASGQEPIRDPGPAAAIEAGGAFPTDMPTGNRPMNLGSSMADQASRLDAVAKVTGGAVYSRDRVLDGMVFASFVRCPYGKARLISFDKPAALAVPGVLEVEIDGDEGLYHGHNIGHVAGETRAAVRRGLRALDARWDIQASATSIMDRAGPMAEIDAGHQAALDGADHVLDAVYTTEVQTHSPLETHGAVVDHRGDEATVYASTQGTSAAADGLEDPLGLPRASYEVICEYIGGGFGSKLNGAGKEGILAARVSRTFGRPASVFTERDEDHLDTGNRPSSRSQVRIGYNDDGTIVGGQIHTWGGVGVSRRGGGVSIPSGHYGLGQVQKGRGGHEDVQLDTGAPRPFRAPGRPQGVFAEELMLDEIAANLEMDPLALRLKLEKADDRRKMFTKGAELIGWKDRRPNGSQTGSLRRGFGLGASSWGRFPASTAAEVVVHRDGSVEARTGTQDIGTGARTVAAVVASEYLGAPLDHVRVAIGRSTLPRGPGSGGSMTSHNLSPAMMLAARDAQTKILGLVAENLDIDVSELDLRGGEVRQGGKGVMTFAEACGLLPDNSITGHGETGRRGAEQPELGEGNSNGVQFVDLTVDVETGVVRVKRIVAVQSCGRVVCRKTAESQVIGGVIQGVSYALFEQKIHDRATGAMVNANLEQYKIAGAGDTPDIVPVLWTNGQTGVRSLGEPVTIPTSGAIACAVFNAIGRPLRSLPITPDRVLAALSGGAP
jgi:CO/xanthine dehydrogenase Mo-binding subunit/aerobic-type carbon monoxide dehydrogenase small subunit (CoxS/CutS family)